MAEPLEVLRRALPGAEAWVVGGALRDARLGLPVDDVDVVLVGDVREAAKTVAKAAGGPRFELSEAFGAWRVLAPDRTWQADLSPLREGSLEADLGLRDFTINAMAQPLAGGDLIDPTGGAADPEARRLRMVAERACDDDPLRVVRAARLATELGSTVDAETLAAETIRAPRAA